MSYIFKGCTFLRSFTDDIQHHGSNIEDEKDIININSELDTSSSFYEDEKKIDKLDFYGNNYDSNKMPISQTLSTIEKQISSDFSGITLVLDRNSLSFLIDSNVTDIRDMFYKCHSLNSLPDL